MDKNKLEKDYKNWFADFKKKIASSQIKAALVVNKELILLYWKIGNRIINLQKNAKYCDAIIKQVVSDLEAEFLDIAGFSRSNLYFMTQFYLFYNDRNEIVEQPVRQSDEDKESFISTRQILLSQITWGHHILILKKIKNQKETFFYINEIIENN